MAEVGDCATVLEQFIHDAANLPAEISYMLEEVQAYDKDQAKHLSSISSKESALQKQVKNHGSLVAHPKEQEYADFCKKHYDSCLELQSKKIAHADKASAILDRQVKRLDERIRLLQRSGQMDDESLPSVFDKKTEAPKVPIDLPLERMALQSSNLSALNANRGLSVNAVPIMRHPQPRQLQQAVSAQPTPRNSAPATPASTAVQAQKQGDREHSAGADSKRRKLNMSTNGINLPSQPSGLRQSSIGPGTPKSGTPTGSRAGSIPHATVPSTKKLAGLNKKVHNPAVTKLKNKHTKHVRLSQSGARKKAGSPAIRGARAGTEVSEDSVLSSADASDTDTSQVKRRRKKAAHLPAPQSASEDEADDKVYCYCSQPSYGEMVGCENPDCKREWFHIPCLGLKSPPSEERWYCPECRTEFEGQASKKRK